MASGAPEPKAKHTVKKLETLEKIASIYGFKNIKDIWDHRWNKDLVRRRKDPKAIVPGDIVVIPTYNDKEKAKIQQLQPALNRAAGQQKHAAAGLEDAAKAELEMAQTFEDIAADHAKTTDALIKEFEGLARTAKNWSDGVDFAAMLINVANGIRSLAQAGLKNSAPILAEAEKKAGKWGPIMDTLTKDLFKTTDSFDIGMFLSMPVIGELSKVLAKSAKEAPNSTIIDDARLLSTMTLESYGKLTSPSYYGQAIGALWEGKTLSQALTFDLEADSKKAVEKLKAEKALIQKVATTKAAKLRTHAAKLQKSAADARSAASLSKKAADELTDD